MRDSTRRALDRVDRVLDRSLDRMRRRDTRSGWISRAVILFGIALLLNGLLIRFFVPAVWVQFIPGGVPRMTYVEGWPGLLAKTTMLAFRQGLIFWGGLGALWLLVTILTGVVRLLRPLAWLGTAMLIGSAAFIVFITMRMATVATLSSVPRDAGGF